MTGYWLFLAGLVVGPALLLRYFNTHPLGGTESMPSPRKISEWIDAVVEREAPRPAPRRKQEKEGSK